MNSHCKLQHKAIIYQKKVVKIFIFGYKLI